MSISEQIMQAKPEEMSDIVLAYQKRHKEGQCFLKEVSFHRFSLVRF